MHSSRAQLRWFLFSFIGLLPLVSPAASENSSSFLRVLTMQDYNTRVVILGSTVLGLASGVVGTFMLLRKRSLLGDAVSHATLPGICVAFMILTGMGLSGKQLPWLLAGATCSGMLGMAFIIVIRKFTKLKEDAALGIVLSVFFGIGIALMGLIQKMTTGHAAGLESFIYGKTASMLLSDAYLIISVAAIICILAVLLLKEMTLLCFDADYAQTQGWPVAWLDALLMALVVVITVIGLQAVGLILMIALLIIPAAAARFWCNRVTAMTLTSALIGACSGGIGAIISAAVPRMPAGAVIVVVASIFFLISMALGPSKGVFHRWREQRRLNRNVNMQNLLRALYERYEENQSLEQPLEKIKSMRAWNKSEWRTALHACIHAGEVQFQHDALILTDNGLQHARNVVRNHRLWEVYLVTHADIAPSHVDRDADQIEHILGDEMIAKLEALLEEKVNEWPKSPHSIQIGAQP